MHALTRETHKRYLLLAEAVTLGACASNTESRADSARRHSDTRAPSTSVAASTSWDAARLRGADFRGIGQEPGWTLDVHESMQFMTWSIRVAAPNEASELAAFASDGSWIGYAELRQGAPTASTVLTRTLPGITPIEIVPFYVEQRSHGQGVAQALMRACEEQALLRACDALWLQAWQPAAQALRFYEKAGFEIYGTAVFNFGERADKDFILARALTRSHR